jgi:chemotaxis protein methyltransferase CheR
VLNLFNSSLIRNGFLCLGTKESMHFSKVRDCYTVIDDRARIFRKKTL